MLDFVLQVRQAATAQPLDECQLVPDFLQGRVPLESSIAFCLVADPKLRSLLAAPERGDQPGYKFVGNQSDYHPDWDRKDSQDE